MNLIAIEMGRGTETEMGIETGIDIAAIAMKKTTATGISARDIHAMMRNIDHDTTIATTDITKQTMQRKIYQFPMKRSHQAKTPSIRPNPLSETLG